MNQTFSKQKIANYLGRIELFIDLGDIFKYKGERKLKNSIDKKLGLVCIILGFLLLVFAGYYFLFNSFSINNLLAVKDFFYLLPFLSLLLILYGFYLKRDKNDFGFNTEVGDLQNFMTKALKGEINSTEIDNFFTEELEEVIDLIYFRHPDNFIEELTKFVLSDYKHIHFLEKRLNVDFSIFKERIIAEVRGKAFNVVYAEFFLRSFHTAVDMQVREIDVKILFCILCRYYWFNTLVSMGINPNEIEALIYWYRNELKEVEYKKLWKLLSKLKPTGAINRAYTSRATPILDSYSVDYTALAAKGKFVVSLGKEQVLNSMLNNLQRIEGSAILLIGQPGVGKTQLLKHLATRMVVEDVPNNLKDSRLVVLDLNRVLAKSQSIDNFKNIIHTILEESIESKNIVLVFEEIGQIFTMREEGRQEVINLLTSLINDHKLNIVATCVSDDYYKKVKFSRGFVSMFEVLEIKEPTPEVSYQIVMDVVPSFEKKYGVTVKLDAVREVVNIAPKIVYEKVLPDKAIDLLEECVIFARSKNLQFVDSEIIDRVVKSKIGVDVGNINSKEQELLTHLEEIMHKRVIGQEQAIRAVASALRRSRSGLNVNTKPVASFLFYGPTGVGKTEIAKTLAEVYYGNANNLIRIDMSEYQEESNLNRLIGFLDPSGNFGGGFLTESIKQKPFCLLLLDELEKANPKVLDLFLQILDTGFVTDGSGRKVDFTNTIIIATSNAGSREIASLLGSGLNYRQIEQRVKESLREVYRVEFLNRFDKVIMFRSLNLAEIEQVVQIMLDDLNRRIHDKGMKVFWDDLTVDEIVKSAYNPVYGAREIRRFIQDNIEDQIAKGVIDKSIHSGSQIFFKGLKIVQVQ